MIASWPSIFVISMAFWLALMGSAIFAKPIFQMLLKLKARQTIYQYAPGTHQVKQGTPTMGGLIIVAGFLFAALALAILNINAQQAVSVPGQSIPIAAVLLFAGYAAIGFLDDFIMPKVRQTKRGLAWKEKIVLQAVVAVGCARLFYGSWDWRIGLAAFMILFASNAYNFADGLDGLAGSILVGLSLGLIVLSGAGSSAITVAALAGALIPFLYLNAPPAKLFMGDVGSLAIGSVLGLVLTDLLAPAAGLTYALFPYPGSASAHIQSNPGSVVFVSGMILPVVLVSGMLLVELVPVPIQIASVKLFKRKVFPFTPVHHAFEKAGWPETRVVWTFAIAQLLFSMAAIFVATFNPGAFTVPLPFQGGSGIP